MSFSRFWTIAGSETNITIPDDGNNRGRGNNNGRGNGAGWTGRGKPPWAKGKDPNAGGGGATDSFQHVAQYTGTASSSFDIPLTSGAPAYVLQGYMRGGADNINLLLQVTNDNFSTVENGSVYRWSTYTSSSVSNLAGSDSDTSIRIVSDLDRANAGVQPWLGSLLILFPEESSERTSFHLRGAGLHGSDNWATRHSGGLYTVAEAINGIRITTSTSTIDYDLRLFQLAGP